VTEAKKANHRAPVVLLAAAMFRPHPDPDTTNLELIDVENYQVVVRKGQFKPGDLGVYIQPDSVVPQTEAFKFIWGEHVGLDGTVPEKRRRITVRKFRKEWSEGLLLPLSDFSIEELLIDNNGKVNMTLPAPGDDVSDILGIAHYNPKTYHKPRYVKPDLSVDALTGLLTRFVDKEIASVVKLKDEQTAQACGYLEHQLTRERDRNRSLRDRLEEAERETDKIAAELKRLQERDASIARIMSQ
jgi:hypothetical protein